MSFSERPDDQNKHNPDFRVYFYFRKSYVSIVDESECVCVSVRDLFYSPGIKYCITKYSYNSSTRVCPKIVSRLRFYYFKLLYENDNNDVTRN